MSGFNRGSQPLAFSPASLMPVVSRFVTEQEIGAIMRAEDPFHVGHDCIHPNGHEAIASCGEVVCYHCAKVFWR